MVTPGYPFFSIPEESILVVVGHRLAVLRWVVLGFRLWIIRKDTPQDALQASPNVTPGLPDNFRFENYYSEQVISS
jgi:hypothetical protein